MPPFDIFELLKTRTWDVHQQIELRVPVFDPGFNLASYVELLGRFYGFWAPLEAKLSQISDLAHPALDLQSRMKSHLLEADLRILGRDSSTLPHCLHLPAVDTTLHGLGCLYVLEGSTLGGRIISKRIESHLGLRDGSGGAFFHSYGEAVGERWSDFRSFIATQATPGNSEEIVTAALQTFECFFAWLGPDGTEMSSD